MHCPALLWRRVGFLSALLLSHATTLVRSSPSSFATVTSPANNEILRAGAIYQIAWTLGSSWTDDFLVDIDLYRSGVAGSERVLNIGSTNSTSLSLNWPIPSNLGADAVYELKLYGTDPSISVYSDNFQITAGQGGTSIWTSSTARTTATTTGRVSSSVPVATTSGSNPETTFASGSGSGLSGSQLTTILVPSIIGGLILLTLIAFLALYWHRTAILRRRLGGDDEGSSENLKPELDGFPLEKHEIVELGLPDPAELATVEPSLEIDSRLPPQELEGSPVVRPVSPLTADSPSTASIPISPLSPLSEGMRR
ncbi:hypothetical protein GQ53DRAFT_836719 [Thozetella sp. PMI_491]|nr:hypothetical protein GQ53DRAFT_836719 [Thozetella sp. PMI_491]